MTIEKRPEEGIDAWEAYRLYEALGGGRSLAQVADRMDIGVAKVACWSREWDWPGRLQVRSANIAEMERDVVEVMRRDRAIERRRRIDEVRDEEYETGRRLVDAGRKCLATLMEKEKPYASPTGICQMLDLASKLLRLSQGMATERAEVVGEDGGPVKVEFLAALERAYGDKPAGEVIDVTAEPGAMAGAGEPEAEKAPLVPLLTPASPSGS